MSLLWWILGMLAVAFVTWRWLGRRGPLSRPAEQAVLLHLRLEGRDPARHLAEIDARLAREIRDPGLGEIEEPVVQGERCAYAIYGRSADRMFEVVSRVLDSIPLAPGSYAVRRYGAPGAPEQRYPLAPPAAC